MSIRQLLKVEVPKKSVSSKFNSFIYKNNIKHVHIGFFMIFLQYLLYEKLCLSLQCFNMFKLIFLTLRYLYLGPSTFNTCPNLDLLWMVLIHNFNNLAEDKALKVNRAIFYISRIQCSSEWLLFTFSQYIFTTSIAYLTI